MIHNKHEESDGEDLEQEKEEDESQPNVGNLSIPDDLRLISLYGEISEEKSSQIVYSMFAYKELKKIIPIDDEGHVIEKVEPLSFLISTPGGNSSDMFSIYDTMRFVKNQMEIHTIGLGKIMSAGVLLLAAGTKGHRRIGRNARVMLHAVSAGTSGSSHELQNEIEEIM